MPETPKPAAPVDEFKYVELIRKSADWTALMNGFDTIKSPHLIPCAFAFRSNLVRTAVFAMMPSELLFQTIRDQRFQANAIFRATGKGDLTIEEHIVAMWRSKTAQEEFYRQADAFEQLPREKTDPTRSHVGIGTTEHWLIANKEMRASMDALLTSIALESWLFFEALVGDVWCAGVDNGTKAIRARFGAHSQWGKVEDWKPEDVATLISDPINEPGSYFREIGKANFTKFRFMVDCFEAIYPGSAALFGAYVYACSCVRNCIIHSAGKIDKRCHKGIAHLDEFKGKCTIGEYLTLDGVIVNKLRQAVRDAGLALIKHVDALLESGA